MSTIEESLMKGYTEHTKNFDQWCEKAAPILGHVTQCGIFEFDSSGHGFFLANRPDYGETYIEEKGYLFDKDVSYSKEFTHGLVFNNIQEEEGEFVFDLCHPLMDIEYGFNYQEAIDKDTIRMYAFHSDDPAIYSKLVNNLDLFRKFLQSFKKENQQQIQEAKKNKVNFAQIKDDYFVEKRELGKSDRDKINSFLTSTNLIEQGKEITSREWQCLTLHRKGLSASRSAEILGISRRTVETHFENIKRKLRVGSKSELIEFLN